MQSLLGEGIGAQGAHPLAHWHIGALPWGLKPAAFNGADPTAFGPPGDEAMGEFKRTAGQRAVRRPHLYAVAELAHRSVQQQHCRFALALALALALILALALALALALRQALTFT